MLFRLPSLLCVFRAAALGGFCALGLAAPLHSRAAGQTASANAGPPRILVLGDSLSAGYGIEVSQGWVSLLQRRLRQSGYGHVVVNASVSGETTTGALARLPRALQRHRPAIVIVELGGNDGLRALPPADLQRNLLDITRQSQQAGAKVLLLGMQLPPNYGGPYTQRFAAAYPAAARQAKVPLVPFFLAGVAERPDWFQADGIHPVAAAQPRLLDNLWPALRPLLGQPAR